MGSLAMTESPLRRRPTIAGARLRTLGWRPRPVPHPTTSERRCQPSQSSPRSSSPTPAPGSGGSSDNHDSSPGVWLKIAKKGAPAATVDHPQALEQAIRYGWIDGQKRGFDEHYWLQRFTPRGPRSKWSQVNRDKALELIAAKRMKPAGLAQFEAARSDGRLDEAYEPQSRATVPAGLPGTRSTRTRPRRSSSRL